MSTKRVFISFLTSIFFFFVLIGPVPWIQSGTFGYALNKDCSLVFNHNLSDSVLGLKKPLFETHLSSSNFSLREDDWRRLGIIPVADHQGSPSLDRGFYFLQKDYAKKGIFSSPRIQRKFDYKKASIIGGLNVAAITVGFHEAISTWGKSKSRFHIKDDWKGDGLAQTDEVSHFMWGYKMTQFLYWAYDWVGFSPKTSRTLSICESSLILTLVEYPIDAYNPQQGLGISDLIFNYLGVGMAITKKHCGWLSDFDFKLSWKKNVFSQNQTVFAQTSEEFDNFIYWFTYRTKLFLPKKLLCFGFGYSASRSGVEPRREFYGGIGLSIPDFASLFGKRAGSLSKFLEILYPNIHIKL